MNDVLQERVILCLVYFYNVVLLTVSSWLCLDPLLRWMFCPSYLVQQDCMDSSCLQHSCVRASSVDVNPSSFFFLLWSPFFQNLSHKPVVRLKNSVQLGVVFFYVCKWDRDIFGENHVSVQFIVHCWQLLRLPQILRFIEASTPLSPIQIKKLQHSFAEREFIVRALFIPLEFKTNLLFNGGHQDFDIARALYFYDSLSFLLRIGFFVCFLNFAWL